jgi:hypothetical protein
MLNSFCARNHRKPNDPSLGMLLVALGWWTGSHDCCWLLDRFLGRRPMRTLLC